MDNPTTPISIKPPSGDRTIKTQRAFWSAIIFTAVALISFIFSLFLVGRMPSWQVYTIAALTAVALVVDIIGAVLIWRGRTELGLKFFYWSLLFTVPPNVLLVSNTTPILVAIVLVVGFTHVFYLQPRAWRKFYQFGPVLASIFMVVVDFIQPSFRLDMANTITASGYFGPMIFVFLVAGLVVLSVRQVMSGSLRTKLLAAFIGVSVIATSALGIYMYITTSNNLRGNLDRELSALAVSRATSIGDLLDKQINTLSTLSLDNVLLDAVKTQNNSYSGDSAAIQTTLDTYDAQWRAADAEDNNNFPLVQTRLNNAVSQEVTKYRQTFPDNVEVFVTDVYGGLVGSTNRTSDYYQADEEWWQNAYNDGQGGVYISQPEFDESANAIAVLIALPIRDSQSDEITGILRTTYILSPLASILSDKIGQTDETSLILPGEFPSRINSLGEYEPVEVEEHLNLHSTSDQAMVEMEYNGGLKVMTQAQVRTLEDDPTVNDLGWILLFHQDRDEAFAPLNTQVRGLIIVMAIVVLLAAAAAFVFSQVLVSPILKLTTTAEEVSAGDLGRRAEVTVSDEVGTLATAFNTMTSRLQETLQGLELRVAERTQNLELAAEVAHSVSQVRALDIMMRDTCDLIQKKFDLYYVQVYLTDPSQTKLVLEAGTGEVGAQLTGRGHSLPLNASSINGRAAVEKHTVLISDTSASATFRPNPLLPDTRAEMAVPLIVADKVVGVLDMQSSQHGVLDKEALPAFEALAGQLAVAIQNANLVADAEQARAEVEMQARRLVRTSWNEYLDAVNKPEQIGYVFDHNQIAPLTEVDEEMLPDEDKVVSAPISLTGEEFGALVVELDEERRDEQTDELVNIVARQVTQQLENLRLLESAERYRFKAEKAARLQTREGWKQYMQSRTADGFGYLYDLKEVRPHKNGKDNPEALNLQLKVRDEAIGKMSVQGLTPDDGESVELANAVAERLSAHLESLRLLEETKQSQVELDQRARQLAAVAEISTASSQELEVDKLLSTVVHLTQRQFDLYHAHIFTYEEATEELRVAACGWKDGDEHEGTNEIVSIPMDKEQSLVARAARTRQAVIVNDVKSEPGWLPNEKLPDTASEMAVPLVIGDQVLGVMDVQSELINAFSEEDANIQMTLASQVATAMQNARSFALAQKQAERETLLNTINQKIQAATSVEAVLQIAARELGHALGAPMTIAQLSMKDQK